jgi:hypothetical protein
LAWQHFVQRITEEEERAERVHDLTDAASHPAQTEIPAGSDVQPRSVPA